MIDSKHKAYTNYKCLNKSPKINSKIKQIFDKKHNAPTPNLHDSKWLPAEEMPANIMPANIRCA